MGSVKGCEAAIHDVSRSEEASSHPLTEWIDPKGPRLLAEIQEAEPLGGAWGGALTRPDKLKRAHPTTVRGVFRDPNRGVNSSDYY